jgi:hypothetical protein
MPISEILRQSLHSVETHSLGDISLYMDKHLYEYEVQEKIWQ